MSRPTVLQELISEFEEIKKTKCNTLQEVIFFDGVLAIIEGKYLAKEREQLISFAYSQIQYIDSELGDLIYKKVPEELFK